MMRSGSPPGVEHLAEGGEGLGRQGRDDDGAGHRQQVRRRNSAMRSTCGRPRRIRVASLPMRRWKAARIDGLVVVAHGDDEGKAEFST
jgi:hypothetical protein